MARTKTSQVRKTGEEVAEKPTHETRILRDREMKGRRLSRGDIHTRSYGRSDRPTTRDVVSDPTYTSHNLRRKKWGKQRTKTTKVVNVRKTSTRSGGGQKITEGVVRKANGSRRRRLPPQARPHGWPTR